MIRDQARRTPWLLVGSLLLLPAACSDGPRALPTGIVVEVTSDFETPPLDDVQLTVTGDGAALFYDQTFSLSSGSYRLPLRVGLEPQGDPNAPFQVKATGQVGGISIVERSATLHFIVGKVLFLQLPLQMVCQGHSCPGATSTCLANGSLDCVPDTVDPGELPTYHPTDGGAGSGGGGVGGGGIGGAGGRGGATGSGAAAGSGGAAGTGGAGGTGGASGTGGGGTGAAGTGGVTGAGGASGRGGTGGGAGLGGTGGAAGRGGAGGVATGGAGGSSGGAGRGGTGGAAGRGGAGGATGAAGTSGTGGATGAAGAGGSGGVGGRGGTSGGGGSGGAGGPAGMGGAGGTGGGGTVIALNDQLVGFWTFDAAGTSFPDYSGNANTITAVATYWTASGVDGGALDLSAPDAAVGAPASVSVNGITTAITIAVWVKPGPIGMVRTIISRYLGTGYWKLGFSDNGALRFTVGPSTLQTASAVSDPTDWTHVVATYDGATARLYVDGTMSTSANLGAISLVGGPATGGGYGPLVGGTFMDVTADTIEDYGGQLDELLLYKRALTSMEVTALARGTLPTRH